MLLADRNGIVATPKSSNTKPLDGEVMPEVPTLAQTVAALKKVWVALGGTIQ